MNNVMDKIKRFLGSRSLKYGSNAIILTAVVIAIAVFVNVLVGMADVKWDLTSNKLFSIGDTTKTILNGLQKDVTIYGLFDEKRNQEYKEVTELLNLYDKYPHIDVQYIDPDRNPGFIKDMDPDGSRDLQRNDFIVKSGNKLKKLEYYDLFQTEFDQQTFQQNVTGSNAEQGLTGAIKYVTSDKTPVIYFTEGHGEYKLTGDFNELKSYLERNNYEVKTLNLISQASIPEDAELLMVASPKQDMSVEEKDRIKAYLDNGGKAIFMFDSLEEDTQFTQFDTLLQDFNVALNYDKVKENDDQRHFPDNPYAILLDVQSNSIIPGEFQMVLDNSRSINILKNQKEYITVTSLMKTSDKAEGEQINKSRGGNNPGPLDLAVAVENKGKAQPSKIIVMGNGSFMTEQAREQYGQFFGYGANFFLYSLNWMLDKQDDVVIGAKAYETPQLEINALQANIVGLALIIVLPLIILVAGFVVYARRRHL